MTGRLAIRLAGATAATALLAIPAGLATAQSVRSSVDLNGGVGYATNPFLIDGDDTESALAEVTVRPQVTVVDETSTTVLSAYLRHQQYARRYDGATSFGATAGYNSRISERTSFRAGAFIDSAILGGANFVSPVFTPPAVDLPAVPGAPTPTPTPPPAVVNPIDPSLPGSPIIIDPTLPGIGLIGTQARQISYGASLGLDHQPSVRDTLSVGANIQRSTFGQQVGLFGADFNQYVGTASYSRQVNEDLSLGLQGVVSRAVYDDGPSSTVYQPSVIFTQRLSAAWSLNGSVGASFATQEAGELIPRTSTTSLAFNLAACRRGARSSLCLSGARSDAPSGFAGLVRATSLSANYSYQLGERDGLSVQAGYSRVDGSTFDFQDQELFNASANWAHRVTERLSANMTLGYRDIYLNDFDRNADVSILLSLGYRLGDRR